MDTPLTDQSIKLNLLTTFFCSALSPYQTKSVKIASTKIVLKIDMWVTCNRIITRYQVES